jgi:dihydrofolate reductase
LIAVSQSLSLDGVMQSPGPNDVPFRYRGWAMEFDLGSEGERFHLAQAQHADALLLGRVTYEAMHSYWPTAEGAFADRLNELPKYVVSSTLTDPSWNVTVLGEDWRDEVAGLRKQLHGDLLLYGSRRLVHELLEMGLVDELRLSIYPVVLGAGDRLFGERQNEIPARLVETRQLGDGVVLMVHALAGGGESGGLSGKGGSADAEGLRRNHGDRGEGHRSGERLL